MEVKEDVETAHPVVETVVSETTSSENLAAKQDVGFQPIALTKTTKKDPTYRLLKGQQQPQLRNNLSVGVGFLEFANALDFAANIWNQSPLPRFVVALMAIGGSWTLLLSTFALFDFRRSWKNTRILRDERKYLHQLRSENDQQGHLARDIDRILGVNYRELTSEVVDRVAMDFLLGFAGLLVGIGTLIAIPGANNPRVYLASNLLSGYIGNAFPLLWGVLNFVTSMYIWWRFQRQARLAAKFSHLEPLVADVVLRCRQFQRHAWLTSINGVVAGVAGMITFKYWWAYVILIPCIIASVIGNLYYRMRIGYDRYLVTNIRPEAFSAPHNLSLELMDAHVFCVSLRQQELPTQITALGNLEKPDMTVASRLLESNRLFPRFSEWLFNKDERMAQRLFWSEDHSDQVVITGQNFAHADIDRGQFYRLFKLFLLDCGPRHFESRRSTLTKADLEETSKDEVACQPDLTRTATCEARSEGWRPVTADSSAQEQIGCEILVEIDRALNTALPPSIFLPTTNNQKVPTFCACVLEPRRNSSTGTDVIATGPHQIDLHLR
ncbi:hypothetical protein PISL3812_01570 [Talaromyces islandicus]|uniref:Integral membrane protein n=1 Tax=Talaromyces islandicus TaxID=28573 RepID=A0A0U1LN41_TALIS|nr:hypothetical protein PISL3812_01570 [Talaromyces islandicus]